jgi:hypothetical protein
VLSHPGVGLVRTIQIHMVAMLGEARRAHVRRPVYRRGRRPTGQRLTRDTTTAAPAEDCGSGEATSCAAAAQWRTGDVARRHRWRTRAGGHRGSQQQDSWTCGGAARTWTRRAGVYALLDWDNLPGRATRCFDWSEERDVGRSRLDRVEGGGENGKPGRTGHQPRCAVAGVLT